MSFGKIYTLSDNPRSVGLKVVAKSNKLDIDFADVTPVRGTAEFHRLTPLDKIPAFEGSDGYILTESIAIAIYLTSQNEKTTLLGKTKQDYASIVRWMSFTNSEVLPPMGGWFRPILGRDPYNKKNVDDSLARLTKALDVLDKHLLINTFLVGERLTLADIYSAGILTRAYQHFFDKANRDKMPCLTRWYETIINHPNWIEAGHRTQYPTEMLKNVAPKSDAPKKEKAKKEDAAPKAKAKDAEEEESEAPAPKAKHPLEGLDKPTLVLDEWKRQYSNTETREEALPWFWKNFKADEYSLWEVNYKYNEELTVTFMSSNLIGGFFARLEGSRKYIFGAASVYGKNNDSIIRGAFVVRGQEYAPAFDVAPDMESYDFKKLDASKAEDRELVSDEWAWDKPAVVNGKSYDWAQGKVFK